MPIAVRPIFTVVYCHKSSCKRNARTGTTYKQAPKTVTTMAMAHLWYLDKVHSRGKCNKQLVEIRQSC